MATHPKLLSKEKNDKRIHHPILIKKQAVKEIETGEFSIEQVMNKYQMRDRRSIISWMRQYSNLDETEFTQKPIPVTIKRKAAYQVAAGTLTIYQAAREYAVNMDSIRNWVNLYSCNLINQTNSQEMPTPVDTEASKGDIPAEKKKPDLLQLKIAALETMIDIAEEQFNIEIRKKSGTKQSKR